MVSSEIRLTRTNSKGMALPLNFTKEAKGSRMFSGFPDELIQELASKPLALHSHKWSVTSRVFYTDHTLSTFYRAITTNWDEKQEYVSTLEGYRYPFYGTQWHPEKLAFEWNQSSIPHSALGIRIMFYLAEFFVNEARKNFHSFSSEAKERKALIWNYYAVSSGVRGVYVQKYYI
ncbi:gamma-glutamyl hydrolase-like [Cynoglossus semilaevis]|nr:gamma-glutamyl hydrolase-like [Cynoglossus semilaevis]